MGFLSRLVNAGSHNISTDKTIDPTPGNPITPENPGELGTVRSVPVLRQPRYFGEHEASALAELAKQRQADLQHSKEAYSALRQLEEADTAIHESQREYETLVAKTEYRKKEADTAYSQTLHKLRPKYADLRSGFEITAKAADQRVAEIVERLRGWW